MRQSFKQCWDTRAKLRLLEVFEGISGRELVQVRIIQRMNFELCIRRFNYLNNRNVALSSL